MGLLRYSSVCISVSQHFDYFTVNNFTVICITTHWPLTSELECPEGQELHPNTKPTGTEMQVDINFSKSPQSFAKSQPPIQIRNERDFLQQLDNFLGEAKEKEGISISIRIILDPSSLLHLPCWLQGWPWVQGGHDAPKATSSYPFLPFPGDQFQACSLMGPHALD